MPKLLPEEEIAKGLAKVPEWQIEGTEINRKFEFKNFLESMTFVRKVAVLAEEMNHHPDILIQWNRVSLTLSTHSEGGLTKLDFALAQKIDAVNL